MAAPLRVGEDRSLRTRKLSRNTLQMRRSLRLQLSLKRLIGGLFLLRLLGTDVFFFTLDMALLVAET